jgi:hypothetical protein
MKIRFVIVLCVAAMLLVFGPAISTYSQEDVTRVEDSGFDKNVRPPVPFAHDAHNETAQIDDCTACHHVWRDGTLVEDESSEDMECSECHLSQNSREHSYMQLLNAYHLRCKGCHQEQKKGPVQCGECHVKR